MSYSISTGLSVFAALFVLMFAPVSAHAAEDASAGKSGIAVLDLEMIVQQSDVGKYVQAELQKRQKVLQSKADDYKKELRQKEQKLLTDRKGGMEDAKFQTEKKAFEKDIVNSQSDLKNKSVALEKTRLLALNDIQQQIAKITADVADERKLAIVVDRKFVVIAEKSMDITQEVLSRLNKTVKTIVLK